MAIKAVIFDIGNVLIEWQPERFFDATIGIEKRKTLFATIDLHKMNDRIDRGENWEQVVSETAKDYPEFSAEILMWHSHWLEMAQPPLDHSLKLLRTLRQKGTPVFALSNFGVETFAYAEEVYPFLREFDQRFISGHMQMIKPDAAIYEAVETDTKLAPNEMLFADDRIDNIDAAAKRGWHTHLFQSPAGWAAVLVEHGLLTSTEAQS